MEIGKIKMASKKTYKPKPYVPEAVDGDNDGLVQDGTEFERPVETEIVFEPVRQLTYTVKDGENILTVADKFKPEGMTRKDYAEKLLKLNGQVVAGRVINLG